MFIGQSAADGALPALYAALGGDFKGPSGKGERRGPPAKVQSPAWTHELDLGKLFSSFLPHFGKNRFNFPLGGSKAGTIWSLQ